MLPSLSLSSSMVANPGHSQPPIFENSNSYTTNVYVECVELTTPWFKNIASPLPIFCGACAFNPWNATFVDDNSDGLVRSPGCLKLASHAEFFPRGLSLPLSHLGSQKVAQTSLPSTRLSVQPWIGPKLSLLIGTSSLKIYEAGMMQLIKHPPLIAVCIFTGLACNHKLLHCSVQLLTLLPTPSSIPSPAILAETMTLFMSLPMSISVPPTTKTINVEVHVFKTCLVVNQVSLQYFNRVSYSLHPTPFKFHTPHGITSSLF